MEEENIISGTIEEVSSQLFVVSAIIADEKKFFWCERDKLFLSGSRFKGHLDDVLEEFMKIDLMVKPGVANDFVVLAAWVGDKPDIVEVGNTLPKAVYNQKGKLSTIGHNLLIVPLQLDQDVLVTRRDILYLDGSQLEQGVEDFIGQSVSFDARPLSFKDPTGASYYATCVWLGETEPKIDDRFRLRPEAVVKQENIDSEDDIEMVESPIRKVTTVVDVGSVSDDIQILEVIQKQDSTPDLIRLDSDENLNLRLDSDENLNLQERDKSNVFEKYATGTVCVIASSELAVVDVCIDDVEVKAKLLRESLDQDCRDIRQVLSVGDRLCMLLRSSYPAHSAIPWFVVKASKGNPNPKQLAEKLLPVDRAVVVKTEKVGESAAGTGNSTRAPRDSPSVVPISTGTGNRVLVNGDSVSAVPKTESHASSVQDKSTPTETSNVVPVTESKTGKEEHAPSNGDAVETRIKTEIQVLDEFAPRVTTLKPVTIKPIKIRTDGRTETILNGSGTLVGSGLYYVADMSLLRIRVLIDPSTFYVDGILYSYVISRHIGTEINFDARVLKKARHSSGATHRAVLSWKGKKPSPQTVLKKLLVPSTSNLQLQPDTVYCGLVMEVPFLDCCIVKFGAVPVLVPAKCLFVDPWTKDTSPVIVSDYLKFGDHVALTCKIEGNCVVAEICGTIPSSDSLFGAVGTFNKTTLSAAKNNVTVSTEEAERQLCPMLKCWLLYLEERVAYRGIIASFPFRNHAIANIGEIRVLIPVNTVVIVNENRKGKDTDCIAELLTVGSTVLLWVGGKVDGRNSYYFAKEVRVMLENSVKNKVVVKNYKGAVDSLGTKERYNIKLRGNERGIESEIHFFRLFHEESGGPAAMHKVRPKIQPRVVVLVNASLNKDYETLHSVWLR